MSEMKISFEHFADHNMAPEKQNHIEILAVGDTREWQKSKGFVAHTNQIAFADFPELTPELLADLSPEIVISPLLTRTFDCIDLAMWLSTLGFQGQYRAIAFELPSPRIVIREINALCPGLDFDVVEMPSQANGVPRTM